MTSDALTQQVVDAYGGFAQPTFRNSILRDRLSRLAGRIRQSRLKRSDAMIPDHSGYLCERCSGYDIKAALHGKSRDQILDIEPFDCSIDEEQCDLCQIARHLVWYQDKHDNHTIRISPTRERLVVERLRDGNFCKSGYICALEDAEKCFKAINPYGGPDEVTLSLFNGANAPFAGWYEIYDEDIAVAQTVNCLEKCDLHHQCLSRSGYQKLPESSAFFIDVINNNIVAEHTNTLGNYFALSYVCGNYAAVELTTKNQRDLSECGALLKVELPQTSRDAMRFTKLCGVRYIWIDFLCILHGDSLAEQRQIDAMDKIYGNATLVLVAALGTSAAFGLYPKKI